MWKRTSIKNRLNKTLGRLSGSTNGLVLRNGQESITVSFNYILILDYYKGIFIITLLNASFENSSELQVTSVLWSNTKPMKLSDSNNKCGVLHSDEDGLVRWKCASKEYSLCEKPIGEPDRVDETEFQTTFAPPKKGNKAKKFLDRNIKTKYIFHVLSN